MTYYLIVQGIAAAVLWSLVAICYIWNKKAQTLTGHGFFVFTFFTALTFTALGALGALAIVKMAVVQ